MGGTAVFDDGSAGRDCGNGGRVDGTAGWNCRKADRTQKVQGEVDGNDRDARRSCGEADSTRDADRTRKTATAVSAVGTGGTVAGGTGSCVRCGIGGLFGGD